MCSNATAAGPFGVSSSFPAVHVEQVFPAAGAVVDASEAREGRHELRVEREHLAEAREGRVPVTELLIQHLASAMQERHDQRLIARLLRLELEGLHQLLVPTGTLRRTLERVDGAQVVRVEAEDAAVGVGGLRVLRELVLVDGPHLEQIGDGQVLVSGLIDGALVELDQLAPSPALGKQPCQGLERGWVARDESEGASVVLDGLRPVVEVCFEDLGDASMGGGSSLRLVVGLCLGPVHSHEALVVLPPQVELSEGLQRRHVARLESGEPTRRSGPRRRRDRGVPPRAAPAGARARCARPLRLSRRAAFEHLGERLPLLALVVQAGQLAEDERIARRADAGPLQGPEPFGAVAEPLDVQPTDAVEGHGPHARIGRVRGLELEHADEVAPPPLRMVQPLERFEGARRGGVETKRRLVELDGGIDPALTLLDTSRPLHDQGGAVARVTRHGVRLALVGRAQRVPALGREVVLLECLQDAKGRPGGGSWAVA